MFRMRALAPRARPAQARAAQCAVLLRLVNDLRDSGSLLTRSLLIDIFPERRLDLGRRVNNPPAMHDPFV